ncbi:MAG: AAA family ATPase [Anaerolineae bacterium]|jgi:putative ATPase|nr:AAA family ATPase [Chloroflexota bacterium]
MDLFAHGRQAQIEREAPLAARMRPRTMDEFVGQEHVVGPGRLLRRAIQADQISSLIFCGPPGTGKTTLARVIANSTNSRFVTLNAVLAGVAQLREVVAEASEQRSLYNRRTILFVDEVHRWNKAQQDAMLPWVENGTVIMIGATTENPWFSVNSALLSRSRVFQLVPLTEAELRRVAAAALADRERGYGDRVVHLTDQALDHLVHVAGGDARSLLNALELAVETTPPDEQGTIEIDITVAEQSIQQRAVLYDRDGDYHYDIISAFIKSLRGSDPDAALYWLARMVHAGEDPRFLFRRMLISASEDIGMADPNALVVVEAAARAFEQVGMPEGQFHLAHAAIYLATAEKSNSALGYYDALEAVRSERDDEVPNHLRDANRDKQGFGHGEGYLYPHAYRDHWVVQQYLPPSLVGKVFYQPSDQGREGQIASRVAGRREAQLAAALEQEAGAEDYLTYTPERPGEERWLARAIDQSSRGLEEIRRGVFEGLTIQRHSTVLDLQAGSGLLTWEALRRVPEGGVWAFESDARLLQTLREQAERLEPLSRPIVLAGELNDVAPLLEAGGHPSSFDVVMGRNVLSRSDQWPRRVPLLRGLLAGGASLSLCERWPRASQRLYQLVDHSALADGLVARWQEAEEATYRQVEDPMVNWEPDDLVKALQSAGLQEVRVEPLVLSTPMLVTPAHLERWFGDGAMDRPSYAQQLAHLLTDTEIAQIRLLLGQALIGEPVPWSRTVLFVRGVAQAQPDRELH